LKYPNNIRNLHPLSPRILFLGWKILKKETYGSHMWSPVVTGPVPLGQSQTVGLKMAEKGLRNQLNHSRVETLLDVAKIGKYPPVNSWLLLVETPFLLVIYVIYNVCR
jgi:hypothetical protein